MAIATELNISPTADAMQMADAIFGEGIQIVWATYTGDPASAGTYSGANSTIPGITDADSGVILSTGNASDFTNNTGTNDTNMAAGAGTDTWGLDGDANLNTVAGQPTYDGAIFEASFIPQGDYLTMRFVLSSEEYSGLASGAGNDVFGVWVNGQFVEATITPTGKISADTINASDNQNLYHDNAFDAFNTEMDGFTYVMSFKAPVNPGEANTIKIGIADNSDTGHDSNLLISGDSIQTVTLAMDDEVQVAASGTRIVDVLANDRSLNDSGLTVTQIMGQDVVAGQTVVLDSGEQVTLNADGTLTVTADSDTGSNVLTYQITDADGNIDTGYLTIHTVTGPAGLDGVVQGTAGDDLIDVSYTGDVDGDRVDNSDATGIYGTQGQDDYIQADAGNDTVLAGDGNDFIAAEEGNDSVNAGDGNDTILAGAGDDTVMGGQGDDTVYLGSGNDNAGSDGVEGNGDDSLYGGAGNDTLLGGKGADQLDGGAGDDVITGGPEGLPPGSAAYTDLHGTSGTVTGTAGNPDFSYTVGSNTGGVQESSESVMNWSGGSEQIDGYQVGNDSSGNEVHTHNFSTDVANVQLRIVGLNTVETLVFSIDGQHLDLMNAMSQGLVTIDWGTAPFFPDMNGNLVSWDNPAAGSYVPFTLTIHGPLTTLSVESISTDGSGGGTFYELSVDTNPVPDGADELLGGDGNDLISGGGGNDMLSGEAGNDTLQGGTDSDTVYGGAGRDVIFAAGNDVVFGGEDGDDFDTLTVDGIQTISYGGGENEDGTIILQDGSTINFYGIETIKEAGSTPDGLIWGTSGSEVIGAGYLDANGDMIDNNDAINANPGSDDDEIYAQEGDDTIQSGLGDDRAYGGIGNDLVQTSTGNDYAQGDAGNDTVEGGEGDDFLRGDAGNDFVYGGDGNDSVYGGADTDHVYGGAGNDEIYGGYGTDTVYGGTGDDTITGSGQSDVVYGDEGNDFMHGSDGADTMYGGLGADTMLGEEDGDIFYGGAGDYIDGYESVTTGTDNDILYVTGVQSVVFDAGNSENGIVHFNDGTTLQFYNIEKVIADGISHSVTSDEVVEGTQGSDTIDAGYTGDPEGDRVDAADNSAGTHDDVIEAYNGNDSVSAGAGNDLVYGGEGKDTLSGGDGNDTLSGDNGSDSLTGNAGDDHFVLNDGPGNDTIVGGETGETAGDVLDASTMTTDAVLDLSTVGSASGEDGTLTTEPVIDSGEHWVRIFLPNTPVSGFGVYPNSTIDFTQGQWFYVKVSDLDNALHDSQGMYGGGGGGQDMTQSFATDLNGLGVVGQNLGAAGLSFYTDSAGHSFQIGWVETYGSMSGSVPYQTYLIVTDTSAGGPPVGTSSFANMTNADAMFPYANFGVPTDVVNFSEIEDIHLGSGDDRIIGSAGNDHVSTGAGADTIDGGAGNDTFDLGGADNAVDQVVLGDGDGDDILTGFEAPLSNADGSFTGKDQFNVAGLTDAGGAPIDTQDVVVTDTNGDGTGNAILTFPDGTSVTLIGITPPPTNVDAWLVAMGIPPRDYTVEGTAGNDVINAGYTGDPEGDLVDANDNATGTNDDLIEAYGGHDLIDALSGNDTIYGGDGNDTVFANADNDIVFGEAGSDLLHGGASNDTVYGGADNDTVTGDAGRDSVYGGDGDDRVEGNNDADTLFGGLGNDQVYGGEGDDIVHGDVGNDTLYGDAGNDSILGGLGNDQIDGGIGNDTISGGAGNDHVTAGDGDDSVDGGFGTDTLHGDAGNDHIDAGAGNDSVTGDAGQDIIAGEGGSDTVDGGDGNDLIYGGGDPTAVPAGLTIWANDPGHLYRIDIAEDGTAVKTLVGPVSRPYGDIGMNNDGQLYGVSGGYLFLIDTASGAETLVGSIGFGAGNNALSFGPDGTGYGATGSSIYRFDPANPGNATHWWTNPAGGYPAGDFLFVGDQAFVSWVNVSSGQTQLLQLGLDGNGNVISQTALGALPANSWGLAAGPNGEVYTVANYGGENTLLQVPVPSTPIAGGTGSLSVTQIAGTTNIDSYWGATSNQEAQLGGGADLGDSLTGGVGNDTIYGAYGNDTILGGADNDLVYGGVDNDVVSGGAGSDVLHGDSGDDQVDGGDANDTLYGEDGNDSLAGGDGSDSLAGDTGNDLLQGGADADTLHGDAGDDTLQAGTGADIAYGGADNDQIDGGSGNDLAYGGTGDDTLTGGSSQSIEADLPPDYETVSGATGTVIGTNGNPNTTYATTTTGADILQNSATVLIPGGGSETMSGYQVGNGYPANETHTHTFSNPVAGAQLRLTGINTSETVTIWLDGVALDLNQAIADGLVSFSPGAGTPYIITPGGQIGASTNDFSPHEPAVLVINVPFTSLSVQNSSTDGFGNGTLYELSIDSNPVYIEEPGGDDTLFGDAGNDHIFGEDGNDVLSGGAGADELYGGSGNDLLNLDAGNDTAFGGDDRDTFVVTSASGPGMVVDGNEGGNDYDVLDLSGYTAGDVNIIYDVGNPENGTVEFFDGSGALVGTMAFSNIEKVIPCFTPGALISTDRGEVLVEDLREGDRVLTRDHGYQEIRWIGRRDLAETDLLAAPKLCPVRIDKGALGAGLPDRDLLVSPQHRMLVSSSRADLLFGEHEVLVVARHLAGLPGVCQIGAEGGVSYIHLLFDRHEIVRANGSWTESYQPGAMTLAGMDDGPREELLTLFPELKLGFMFPAARMSLRKKEAMLLLPH